MGARKIQGLTGSHLGMQLLGKGSQRSHPDLPACLPSRSPGRLAGGRGVPCTKHLQVSCCSHMCTQHMDISCCLCTSALFLTRAALVCVTTLGGARISPFAAASGMYIATWPPKPKATRRQGGRPWLGHWPVFCAACSSAFCQPALALAEYLVAIDGLQANHGC